MSGETSVSIPKTGNAKQPHKRRLYPVNEAAILLGISPAKVWDLIYTERIATRWIDNRRLVPAEVIDEFIENLPSERPDLKAVAA